MRITFVLPAPIRIPMGGAAVAFRHAGGLAARGHEVTVVSPRRTLRGLPGMARMWGVGLRDRLQGVRAADYYAAPGVRSLLVPRLTADVMPGADLVIATGVQTARPVAALPPSAGAPVYFIQGDETFVDPAARETWHLPMARVTCATWLADAIRAAEESVEAVIPNAVDPQAFGLDEPVEGREPAVLALYHRHPIKGPDVLIAAIERVLDARPGVTVRVFSARPPSHALPGPVEVIVRPEAQRLRALYNTSSVLLHSSRSEGWGLVPMEAAACGCAVVASANLGVQEFLTPGESMWSAPVGDGLPLGDAALEVLGDEALRQRLATAGRAAVSQYSWGASTARLEEALLRILRHAS